MNIAYVFMGYPAKSETFGDVEINGIKKLGANVDIYSLTSKNKNRLIGRSECIYGDSSFMSFFRNILTFPRFFLFSIKVSNNIFEFLKMQYLYSSSKDIANKIDSKEYDIVHFFWGHFPSLVNYHLRCMHSNVKVSTFIGAYDLTSNLGIMKWGVNNSDLVTTHCEYNLSVIDKISKIHVTVLYRGVDVSDNLKIPGNVNRICFAGRLIKSKGAHEAIKLLALLNKKNEFHLDICGDGPEMDALKSLTKKLKLNEFVHFHGHISQKELFEIMLNASFFLLPTSHKSERLPNVIKEAIDKFCIPITSYTPGIYELLPEEFGLVCDFNDLLSIREKIELLDRNREVKEYTMMKLYDRLCAKFDNKKISLERFQYFKR